MSRVLLAAAACAALCACAADGVQVQVRTVEVAVPTPVSCVPADSPASPAYADTPEALKAARDFAERDALVKGEWARKMARLSYLETLRAVCLKVPAGPG